MNPDTIGCMWTGEFDLNTLRVDGEILNPERKSCGLKNIRIRADGALYVKIFTLSNQICTTTYGLISFTKQEAKSWNALSNQYRPVKPGSH